MSQIFLPDSGCWEISWDISLFQQAPDESRGWDETGCASQVGQSLSFVLRTQVWSPGVPRYRICSHISALTVCFPYIWIRHAKYFTAGRHICIMNNKQQHMVMHVYACAQLVTSTYTQLCRCVIQSKCKFANLRVSCCKLVRKIQIDTCTIFGLHRGLDNDHDKILSWQDLQYTRKQRQTQHIDKANSWE